MLLCPRENIRVNNELAGKAGILMEVYLMNKHLKLVVSGVKAMTAFKRNENEAYIAFGCAIQFY